MNDLPQIVRRAMAVKIKIIEDDPYEKGSRAALNLGHTVGHAVESVSGYRLRHGEAVAIGMVAEAKLAEYLKYCRQGLVCTGSPRYFRRWDCPPRSQKISQKRNSFMPCSSIRKKLRAGPLCSSGGDRQGAGECGSEGFGVIVQGELNEDPGFARAEFKPAWQPRA